MSDTLTARIRGQRDKWRKACVAAERRAAKAEASVDGLRAELTHAKRVQDAITHAATTLKDHDEAEIARLKRELDVELSVRCSCGGPHYCASEIGALAPQAPKKEVEP